MASLGNTGTSALLRSASSIATAQADYKDKLAALEWNNSAKTDADWQVYSAYLNSRIDKLQNTGGLVNASKALTLTSTVQNAQKSFVSSTIQRSSINILEGNGNLQDKANAVASFYQMAAGNGDESLAQSLRGQYDNIDQQIQYQQKVAADAATTLARSNQDLTKSDASKTAAGYTSAAGMLENGLQNLTNEYKQGGQVAFTKALNQFTKDNATTMKAMGVTIPTGATPNLGLVTQGIIHAVGQYNVLASQATAVTNPEASARYMSDAMNIASGVKTFNTPAGQMSYQQASDWGQNPNMFIETQTTGKNGLPQYNLNQSTVSGYKFSDQGKLTPIPSGTTTEAYSNMTKQQQQQVQKQLTNLGFTTKISNGQITVQLTDKTAKWIDPGKINANKNEQLTVIPTSNGFQFTNTDANGQTHLYNIASDARNLSAIYEVTNTGKNQMIHGQYGFNPGVNSMINGASVKQTQEAAVQKQIQTVQQQRSQAILNVKQQPLPGAQPIKQSAPAVQPAYVNPATIKPGTTLNQQEQLQAQNAIKSLLGNNTQTISNTYTAIKTSAGYGNPYDQYKLGLLGQQAPWLGFTSASKLANGNQLSF